MGKPLMSIVPGRPGGAEYGFVSDAGPIVVKAHEEITVSATGSSGTLKTAWPANLPHRDLDYDGVLVGVDGPYAPGSPLAEIRGVRPKMRSPTYEIIFVNGFDTQLRDHFKTLQEIANRAGAEVVGVYNATEGRKGDLLQAAGDKLDWGKNPSGQGPDRDGLFGTNDRKRARSPSLVNIVAHSQGALITSRALEDVRTRLRQAGYSRDAAQRTK